MKQKLLIILSLFFSVAGFAQTTSKLLGICTRDSLMKQPYLSWYQPNYDGYTPDPVVVSRLKKIPLNDYTVEIYFGTWCGDSKREIPRFLKIADLAGLSTKNIRFIAVNTGDQYKQAPGGETLGKGIYRVATFIFYKNGKEVNRITEHPVRTLELDLLDITTTNSYVSNYRAFPSIDRWLTDGLLANENVSVRGLAKQLKPLLVSPSELNSCGYVLMAQNKLKEAETVFSINSYIFYEDANGYLSLAEAQTKNGKHKAALENLEYAFRINKDTDFLKTMLQQYYEARRTSDNN
jgi:thiol-disulfide isomerase/thioredoxin